MTLENRSVKHLFIINPRSFWHKWKQDTVIAGIHTFFTKAGNNNYEIHISRFPRDATVFIPLFARDFPEKTVLRVYAVGGDGILFDCLNGIMGLENVELAAIPYGRTNNFIRGFGKNVRSLFRNLSRQYEAPLVSLDVMRCGDNYALDYCVIGLEAEAVRRAGKIRRRMEKGNTLMQWLSRRLYKFLYFAGAYATRMNKKLFRWWYDVEIDGENAGGIYWCLSIFNGSYYGGNMHPVNNAMPDDGILDMLLIRGRGFLRTFWRLPFYITGHYEMFPRVFTLKQARKIKIRSYEPLIISMDDELFYETELTVELLPAAVKFVNAGWQGYRGGDYDRSR